MSELSPENPQNPEQNEAAKQRLVWMVEDRDDIANSAIMASRSFADAYDLIHFQTGQAAIEKFQELIQQKSQLPDTVLMDYQLDQGVKDPRYRTGVEVIVELKRLALEAKVLLPEIIGISGDSSYSERLLEAGADRVGDKSRLFKLFEELAGEE